MSLLNEVELYELGMSTHEVALTVGAPISSVRYRLIQAGVIRERNEAMGLARSRGKIVKANADVAAKAKALFDQGVLKRDIAKKLGIHRHTVRKALSLVGSGQKPAKYTDTRISYEEFKRLRDQQRPAP